MNVNFESYLQEENTNCGAEFCLVWGKKFPETANLSKIFYSFKK